MIYVGSRNGRKGLGLGLEMDESELEEGEALSYHDEVGDSTIDPDTDLSYIEEKLHKCLGHFQKDFEGGVSAENLGAKFGGYGSFLPAYQRSPSWSHTRSPADAHNYNSPRKPHIEDQRQNSFASSSASPSARPRTASGKAVSVTNSLKGDGYLQARNNEQSGLRNGVSRKPINPSDQPTLKVRLKLGSENLSTQKNAEIYSGLGLVVSPSSSLEDSPTTSAGQCGKLLDMPEESPTSILQIMTSYPGGLLLSPLSEDLIQLTEKRKHRGKRETKVVDKTRIESSGMLVNGSLSSRSNQKDLEQKKFKSSEKEDAFSIDSASQKYNGDKDNDASFLKKEKETDIDTLGCEELVSNALKLPLLSSSPNTEAVSAKDMSTATIVPSMKDGVKGENFSVFTVKEYYDNESAHDIGRVEKSGGKQGSLGKVSESKKGNIVNNISAYHQADVKAEKSHASDQSESNISKGKKTKKAYSAAEPDPSKKLIVQKGGSVSEEDVKPAQEKSSSGGKRKQKVTHGIDIQGACMAKDELLVESSLTPKTGKGSHTNGVVPKNDSHDLQKDHGKPGDRYKDFFGDEEFEDDDNESISGEMTSGGRVKDPQVVGKRSLSDDHNASKDKCNGKSSEKPLPPEKYSRPDSHLAPPIGNGPNSEAPTGMVPLVNEDWVSCDKCQKWRLLPLGTNPKSLPDKWLCRMLTWLPGMNRCSVPEEVTTNALIALYHPAGSVPAPGSESHVRINSSIVAPAGMPSGDARYPVLEQQNIAVQTPAINGKKKHGPTKATNSTDLDGSTHSSNSMKKKNAASGKISMNGGTRSPSLDACGYQHMRQSSSAVEKYNDNKKEKTSLVNLSEKGTNLKIRSKRETDMEGSRASKRIKSEELQFDDENWTSDNGGTSSKAGRGSNSLSNNTSGNDQRRYNNQKDVNGGMRKNAASGMNGEIHVPGTSDNGSLRSGKGDDKYPVRKRKAKEPHGSQIHAEPASSSGRHHLDSSDFLEEMSESEHRKEKKARLSKSGGNDTSGSKATLGTDRKSKSTKEKHNGQSLSNVQVADYLKGDTGSVQPSVAANSSSSKVSGSHKNKTSGQEVKGSPVESVSSSPLRFPNADKVASNRKDLVGKDDFHDSGSLTAASPRRLSGGEGGGNDQTGMVKKDAILTVNNHVSDVHKHSSEQCKVEEKTTMDQSQNSGFHSKKSVKGLSTHSKDKGRASGSDLDKVNMKASDSLHDSLSHMHYEEKPKSRRNKSDEKSGAPVDGISKKDTAGGTSNDSSKGQNQKKFGHAGQDAIKSQDKKHNLQQERDNEKLPMKSNQAEVHGSGKSHSLPPLARVQTDQKENGGKSLAVDASNNGDAPKAPNQRKKAESSNGQPTRHPTPNSHKVRDVEAPSPIRRDSSSHAANNALKEAKDLKHLADRRKNSGSADSIGYYFEAALKFLHGASLLESGSSETTKHNELMHAMQIYSSTAKLCEFCAHEYEKLKDMATAALAYKCMEVAYLRVVFSSHASASRDRNELQAALQIVPPGESPSSSASDVDNLNHQAPTEKAALAKVVGSPQVSGSHMITSRNRSGFLRILNFAQDVNFAMEASRKSRMAFAAANSKLGETSHKEGISPLKEALDFSFQDVEGLLRLVRVAMEVINR